MAAVPSRCARIGGRSLIGSVRWYDSSHPSLADTLKDLGGQAKVESLRKEHISLASERSEPLQAKMSSARVARLKFEPFSLEIDLPNVKSSSP